MSGARGDEERREQGERSIPGDEENAAHAGEQQAVEISLQGVVAHNFPAEVAESGAVEEECDEKFEEWREDAWLYRNRTQSMLRRYFRLRLETGKVPSIMAREFFRLGVSTYTVGTFEDRVIFVCDMERCLALLDEWAREIVERLILQEHAVEDFGRKSGRSRRTAYLHLEEALDELSGILLERGLLDKFSGDR